MILQKPFVKDHPPQQQLRQRQLQRPVQSFFHWWKGTLHFGNPDVSEAKPDKKPQTLNPNLNSQTLGPKTLGPLNILTQNNRPKKFRAPQAP